MNVIHISPIYNRESIYRYGIIPTQIKNGSHASIFKEDGLSTIDYKAIYTWQDCTFNEKLIKDLIYAITWIHPRNEIAEAFSNSFSDEIDWRYKHRNPIYKYDNMLFDIYVIDTNKLEIDYIHSQVPNDDPYNTICYMHDEYAHNNKPLCIYNKLLKNFKIRGQAYYYYDTANKSFSIKIL